MQPLQGTAHLGRWRGGVPTIPEPWKRTRELPFCLPSLDGSLRSRRVTREDPSNWVPPGLRPLGTPLEGGYDHVGGQGRRSERRRHAPIRVHGRAPRSREGMSSNSTDGHPTPS